MVRAFPGSLLINPDFSNVNIIWWTVGGVKLKKHLNIRFGWRSPVDLCVVMNKRQILALLLGILRHSAILPALNNLSQSQEG
jgi:hypothetical protein